MVARRLPEHWEHRLVVGYVGFAASYYGLLAALDGLLRKTPLAVAEFMACCIFALGAAWLHSLYVLRDQRQLLGALAKLSPARQRLARIFLDETAR